MLSLSERFSKMVSAYKEANNLADGVKRDFDHLAASISGTTATKPPAPDAASEPRQRGRPRKTADGASATIATEPTNAAAKRQRQPGPGTGLYEFVCNAPNRTVALNQLEARIPEKWVGKPQYLGAEIARWVKAGKARRVDDLIIGTPPETAQSIAA